MLKGIPEFSDYIRKLYNEDESSIRDITFQVTNDCCCACTYCYQINKNTEYMTKETGKKLIDLILEMTKNDKSNLINTHTRGFVFSFIGGEPFMNIDTIDYICHYFVDRCFEEDLDFLQYWKISIISNGKLYFTPKVQNFLKTFEHFISFNISIDGPKELHDACRIYHDGSGNFNDAFSAMKDFRKKYPNNVNTTKVTISKDNLSNLNSIIKFFVENNMKYIFGNPIFEEHWTIADGQLYYQELKKMADYILELNEEIFCAFFDKDNFKPKSIFDNENWCGGTGKMLAFDPNGVAYPCLRYMPSSLGKDIPPITIGNLKDGILQTDKDKETKHFLDSITRKSQSTPNCFYCPIASGCAWCSAWNYQENGTPDCRSTNICNMHKARSLANVYFWNKYYIKNKINEIFYMHLPKEECLNFIDENEYNMLVNLIEQQQVKINQIDN